VDQETDKTPREATDLPRLLTVEQVAERTGYAAGTIYNMIAAGKLASVKNGDQRSSGVRIPEDAFRAWIEGMTLRSPVKTRKRNYNRRKAA
jgi:excisionase family DNA binding protein